MGAILACSNLANDHIRIVTRMIRIHSEGVRLRMILIRKRTPSRIMLSGTLIAYARIVPTGHPRTRMRIIRISPGRQGQAQKSSADPRTSRAGRTPSTFGDIEGEH
jgi:hypothetical protein